MTAHNTHRAVKKINLNLNQQISAWLKLNQSWIKKVFLWSFGFSQLKSNSNQRFSQRFSTFLKVYQSSSTRSNSSLLNRPFLKIDPSHSTFLNHYQLVLILIFIDLWKSTIFRSTKSNVTQPLSTLIYFEINWLSWDWFA